MNDNEKYLFDLQGYIAVENALEPAQLGALIGKVIRLTASCDHRIIEGATAARFMQTVSEYLEDPDRLVS